MTDYEKIYDIRKRIEEEYKECSFLKSSKYSDVRLFFAENKEKLKKDKLGTKAEIETALFDYWAENADSGSGESNDVFIDSKGRAHVKYTIQQDDYKLISEGLTVGDTFIFKIFNRYYRNKWGAVEGVDYNNKRQAKIV